MRFIDTHSHIYLEDFDEDIDVVISRALAVGVDTIILPNIDSASVGQVHRLANSYPLHCIPLMGLHPTHVKENFEEELDRIFNQLRSYNYKGVGEIGIDLYWDKTFFEQQVFALEQQMRYAMQHELPVVIHARDSFNEIFNCIAKPEFNRLKGIFHAFTGTVEQARWIIEKGLLIGIGGVVTFKNSKLSEVVKNIGLHHLVLETDAPYLTPSPHRGKRNESSYIQIIAQKIAEITNTSLDEVAGITTKNALQLFKI